MPGPASHGWTLDQVVPRTGPSSAATGVTIEQLRRDLPRGSLVGGAAAENYDLEQVLASRTPVVFGMLAALGFILLLVALGAPLIAFAGVVTTGLSVAGAFGVARLIFQDGHLSGLLNFTPQGFVDAWGPLFFGAMVFGVAMDYTLFMLLGLLRLAVAGRTIWTVHTGEAWRAARSRPPIKTQKLGEPMSGQAPSIQRILLAWDQ